MPARFPQNQYVCRPARRCRLLRIPEQTSPLTPLHTFSSPTRLFWKDLNCDANYTPSREYAPTAFSEIVWPCYGLQCQRFLLAALTLWLWLRPTSIPKML